MKADERGDIAKTPGNVTFFHHPLLRPDAHFDDAFGATFSTVCVHMHNFEVLLRRLFRHLAPLPGIYRTNGFLTIFMVCVVLILVVAQLYASCASVMFLYRTNEILTILSMRYRICSHCAGCHESSYLGLCANYYSFCQLNSPSFIFKAFASD